MNNRAALPNLRVRLCQFGLDVKREHDRECGVIITLVAVFMLFVIGAMAALSIDVVTLYTARSEAQLAADAGALAGARALANSGITSDPRRRWMSSATTLATAVATHVASQNVVGGRALNSSVASGEITVTFPNQNDDTDPKVTVQVRRTDLPTFFARIWGSTQITVAASATAEAYNSSGAAYQPGGTGTTIPVAPICVKPWLLPNLDPTGGPGTQIFDTFSGAIMGNRRNSLVGEGWGQGQRNRSGLSAACEDCSRSIPGPTAGQYYPGAIGSDAGDFPAPAQGSPSCGAGFNAYQLAVAGCVQQPISCGATINIDTTTTYAATRNTDTAAAASCLIHANGAAGDSDSIDPAYPLPPFQFIAGNQNPIPNVAGKDVLVSDSLVTIPVINATTVAPTSSVQIIGFIQGFLNPSGDAIPANNQIPVTIINLAGCGTSATGQQPILGNGASPVAVRLITP